LKKNGVFLWVSHYTFWRSSRCIESSHWGASASEICQYSFLTFFMQFQIKARARETFFERAMCVRKKKKELRKVLLLCLSFHFEKERQFSFRSIEWYDMSFRFQYLSNMTPYWSQFKIINSVSNQNAKTNTHACRKNSTSKSVELTRLCVKLTRMRVNC
jgi:hypothetical protein